MTPNDVSPTALDLIARHRITELRRERWIHDLARSNRSSWRARVAAALKTAARQLAPDAVTACSSQDAWSITPPARSIAPLLIGGKCCSQVARLP